MIRASKHCLAHLLLLLSIAGCGYLKAQELALSRLTAADPPFTLLSGLDEPVQLVIRDQAAWADAWRQMHSIRRPMPPVPVIEFGRDMVVLVALGARASGGYSVEIQSAELREGEIVVSAVELEPGQSCVVSTGLTAPVDLVLIPQSDAAIRFEISSERRPCTN